jgi:hypothetical protein
MFRYEINGQWGRFPKWYLSYELARKAAQSTKAMLIEHHGYDRSYPGVYVLEVRINLKGELY